MKITPKTKIFPVTDFWRKVVALALGCATWWLVSMQTREVSQVRQVPLQINYDQQQFYLRRNLFDVDLNVLSRDKSLLAGDQFSLTADLPANLQSPGKYNFDLHSTRSLVKKKPAGVKVLTVLPQNLSVSFDVIHSRQVQVQPQISGHLPEGYVMSTTCEPSIVELKGPSTLLKGIEQVKTAVQTLVPTDLESFSTVLAVVSPNPGVINVEPKEILLQVRIQDARLMTTRTLTRPLSGVLLPVHGRFQMASPLSQEVTLTLGGQYRSVNDLDADHLQVLADATGAAAGGVYRARVTVMGLPLGVTLEKSDPQAVPVLLQATGAGVVTSEAMVPATMVPEGARETAAEAPVPPAEQQE